MKKLLLALLLLLTAFPAVAAETETAYDRVMRTQTIRCGYLPYEPFITKDLVSGEMRGLTVDYINAVAAKAGLKVEWAEDVAIDQVVPALDNGRIDLFCVPCTPEKNWVKVLNFTGYLGALPYYVYVREDSTLTAPELETATFATVDGFALTPITEHAFPQAHYASLPQSTSSADMYNQLRYKKADALVNEAVSAMNYMKNNPGLIRRFSDKPVIAMAMSLVSRKDDARMNDFVEATFGTGEPDNLALMRELLRTHDVPEDAYLLSDQCGTPVQQGDVMAACDMKGKHP